MQTLSFFARADSNSANNPSLNPLPGNQFPATEITFVAAEGGNVILEATGGQPDPDTLLVIGGQEYTFTLQFSGALPNRNDLADVNGENLQGERVVVVTVHDFPAAGESTRLFFLPDADPSLATMAAYPNSAQRIQNVDTNADVLICFCAGTRIATPRGEVPVEDLAVGDAVLNAAGEAVTIRWIGRREVSVAEQLARPEVRPVRIRRGALGEGRPRRDLRVSPQHRILLDGWRVEMLFGEESLLAPAAHLVDGLGIAVEPPTGPVTYHHLLFDRHELLLSEGLATESLYPGPWAVSGLEAAARAEVLALFPALAEGAMPPPLARPLLRGREARALMAYLARAA